MSKITKDIRDRIRNNAVDAAFAPRVEAHKKAEAKLAVECYNFLFPKKTRDLVAAVPAEWFRTCSCLRFNANGWSVSLNAGKEMPTPASNGCSNLGSLSGELAERVQAHVTEKRTMDSESASARTKMLGFLEQFTTFKKLEEAWPEGKKFYQDFNADRPSANVPAVITKEINAMLGLKDKKAA